MKAPLIPSDISALFTMVFVFDRNLEICEVSDRLKKRCPQFVTGRKLDDIFDFHRPQFIRGFADILAQRKSLYLLISKDRQLALRGQILVPDDVDSNHIVFAGSPWMSWMTENFPAIELELADFPRHDSQMDHSFYMTAQSSMVKDLEAVNIELTRATEEAKLGKQTQSDFVAVMSHEMRTPLNGVISALGLVEDTTDPLATQKLLKVARVSANNLLSVINYVLDYSKLDANKLNIESIEFDLHETVTSVRDILSARARTKGIDFELEFGRDCPRWVTGDASKVRQILINLASNAVKFTQAGGVRITTTALHQDDGNVTVRFDVEDSGSGIPVEQQARIFDAFWTSSDRTQQDEANTGLGLNICRRVTMLLGGQLTYQSEVGMGSRFTLELTLGVALGQHEPEPMEKDESNEHALFEGDVLLVDDNQTNLLLGKMMLERMGLRIRTASDGREAFEIVTKVPFDLVLMDLTMPEMNGDEATRQIRQAGVAVPIVALTAHVGDGLEAQCRAAGMQGLIHKPINRQELVKHLSAYVTTRLAAPLPYQEPGEESALILDVAVLQSLIDSIGDANFREAYALFQSETASRLGALNEAWILRDMTRLTREAHTLGSSVASFGAIALGKQLRAIEVAARESEIPALITGVPALAAQSRAALDAFNAYLNPRI